MKKQAIIIDLVRRTVSYARIDFVKEKVTHDANKEIQVLNDSLDDPNFLNNFKELNQDNLNTKSIKNIRHQVEKRIVNISLLSNL